MSVTIPKPPRHLDTQTQKWMQTVSDAVSELQGSNTQAPRDPSNLQVAPQPGGNNVVFTVSNADGYQLFVSSTPNFTQAKTIDLGRTNQYSDNVGSGNIKRWYWVRGYRTSGGKTSNLIGPQTGTTLALGTAAAPVPVVPAGDRYFHDSASSTTVIEDQSKAQVRS